MPFLNKQSKILYKTLFSLLLYLVCASKVYGLDKISYDIDCNLNVNQHILIGEQKISFRNNTDKALNEVYFHIYPHRKYTQSEKEFMLRYAGYFKVKAFPEGFQTGDLQILKVTQDDVNLFYKIEGDDQTILKINLSKALLPNQILELRIDFKTTIPHMFGKFGWHSENKKEIISLNRWYPILSVLNNQGWHNYPYYPYHQPFFSDAGNYRIKLNLPKNQVVIHTGVLTKEGNNSDDTKTLIIETELPVRDFSLAISPEYKVCSQNIDGIKINSYFLKGDEFYAQKAKEFASDLIKNYSGWFVNYPYKEFNIAPVYLAYGGAQSSGLIFIDTRVYKLPRFLIRYFDFLISHETGHQWFYNIVGSDEYREMFLDEGINSYFILKHLEEKYGQDAQVMALPKGINWLIPNFSFRKATTFRYIYLAKNGLDRPILRELSSFTEPSSIFSLTYGKGSQVISMLESLVGSDAFKKIFKRYFKEFSLNNISLSEFIKIVNEESKQDLTWFFKEWLETNKYCDYAIESVTNEKIILKNLGAISMPVKTIVKFKDDSILIDDWDGKTQVKEISLKGKPKVTEIVIDPEESILEVERTNNFWPRALYKKPAPIYFFAYEIPVFLPRDSYNLVFGPNIDDSGIGIKSSLQKPFDNILFLSSGYDLNSSVVKSRLGYELKHFLNKQMVLGFELFSDQDLSGKEEDLDGGKLYLRWELWPASYSISQVNDHISLYLVRNRKFANTLTTGGLEDIENLSYLKNEEAIIGATFHLSRFGPYFDPKTGYNLDSTIENAGHFLGGEQYFWRTINEIAWYKSLTPKNTWATKLKFGWGSPNDKNLFQLGGEEGLRGYGLKTIRGSRALLVSMEYRFPMIEDIKQHYFDNLLGIEALQGVIFFDMGESWFDNFTEKRFKKDAGLGFRFHINIGSFLEKTVIRFDIAQAIDEPKEKTHFWLGINQAF